MSFTGEHTCGRCKKEITGNVIAVEFKTQEELAHFRDGLSLCSDCFSAFVEWVKNSKPTEMGPVERVARREESEPRKSGPVERVARWVDDK